MDKQALIEIAFAERDRAEQALYRATHKKEESGYRAIHREDIRVYNVTRRAAIKLEVLNAYGGPICACCGETLFEGLTIDHVSGSGGGLHREHGSGDKFYNWLKQHGFPPGYQVLCATCNLAKGTGDHCPHQD
jgi:hypothetical protein